MENINMKVSDLIIEGLDRIIHESLESVRVDMKIPKKKFQEFLDLEDGKAFDTLYDAVAEHLIDRDFKNQYLQQWRQMTRSTQAKIISAHKKPFLYFFAYIHICFQIYDRIRLALDGQVMDKKTTLHLCLYGNLCRMADEIGILLSHGYTSAALTLWRTFYEHSVVCFPEIGPIKNRKKTLFLINNYENNTIYRGTDCFNIETA
ncbi:DUF5677 domain-containing protein [Pedobacter sp. SL55]|uniref:DUF5677 domain-containing protein n=1 Tax=Pedobacter sp. SL55 TaxID=2995161 RepID=UPI00226ECED1|nr:DUF5677 domain-containing protein [Pedobacter sp. SL55]WAC40375.1 DUF5677 domain-containing protein [Pedobacter sp. SL55]